MTVGGAVRAQEPYKINYIRRAVGIELHGIEVVLEVAIPGERSLPSRANSDFNAAQLQGLAACAQGRRHEELRNI